MDARSGAGRAGRVGAWISMGAGERCAVEARRHSVRGLRGMGARERAAWHRTVQYRITRIAFLLRCAITVVPCFGHAEASTHYTASQTVLIVADILCKYKHPGGEIFTNRVSKKD